MKDFQDTEEASSLLKRTSSTALQNIKFPFFVVIFAKPVPDSQSSSGPTYPTESGSETRDVRWPMIPPFYQGNS